MSNLRGRWKLSRCLFFALAALACGGREELPGSSGKKLTENSSLREQIEQMQGKRGALDVPVLKLRLEPIKDERSITGELVPQKAVIVNPLMDGRITFLRQIKVGDHVKAGEAVAKIDDREIEDKIERQHQQIEISGEKLKLDEEALKQKEKTLEFDRQLLKEGYLMQNAFDQSALELKQAQMSMRQSKLSLDQERTSLKTLERDREKVPIVSPIDGMIVLPSHLRPEQNTSDLLNEDILAMEDTLVGSGTPIFGVVSDKGYLAKCMVNGKDKSRLAVGQRARLVVIGDRPIEIGGEITSIALLQEMESHAYKVWITLDKSDPSFTSGLFVRANIELDRHDASLSVVKEYVKERNNKTFVQTVVDGAVKDVFVTTGIASADKIELTSGVKAGDMVIASKEPYMADQAVNPVASNDSLASEYQLQPVGASFPLRAAQKGDKTRRALVNFDIDGDTTGTQALLTLRFDYFYSNNEEGLVFVNAQGPLTITGVSYENARDPHSVEVPPELLAAGRNEFEFINPQSGAYAVKSATLTLSQTESK